MTLPTTAALLATLTVTVRLSLDTLTTRDAAPMPVVGGEALEDFDHAQQVFVGDPAEQAEELAAAGASVSILVPFGPAWAEYVSSHIALRPASTSWRWAS